MNKPIIDVTFSAADIAKSLKLDPTKARKALRAANIRAPYKPTDKAKITKVLKAMVE